MPYKKIVGLTPTLMGLGLLGEGVALTTKKGKRKVKGIIGFGVKSLVGIPLIGKVADIAKGL